MGFFKTGKGHEAVIREAGELAATMPSEKSVLLVEIRRQALSRVQPDGTVASSPASGRDPG